MIERKKFTLEIGGKTLTVEASRLAEQANAAVIVKYGGTAVLATAVMMPTEANTDYLPLKVDYEERFYAAGKILGSRYVRREGKSSEDAVLSGRLVDRTIRPLFDYRLRRDIQVVMTVLAYDEENDPDFVGLVGVSTALSISDIPWNGPVGGVRLARLGGKLVVNPDRSALAAENFEFETFASGPKGKINMIELSGQEAKEADVFEAFTLAQAEIDKLVVFQEKIVAAIGKPKTVVKIAEPTPEFAAAFEAFLAPKLAAAVLQPKKEEQSVQMRMLKEELMAHLSEKFENADLKLADRMYEDAVDKLVHEEALANGRRPDGRSFTQIRPLEAEVALFERTHGSAIFMRGSTQALAVTTLAAPGAEQMIETMRTTGKRRFMLHYNFPPYSVGEVGNFRGAGRREIGHGALAEKAVRPLIPTVDKFPYTVRVVAETLSSNGSSSMATVCSSVLSLMDAGVPLKKMGAGIAMGLMSNNEKFQVLTDLQGPEDFYGDMDFKVAGTADGITAIQLDTKIAGLSPAIIKQTLGQARDARLEILKFMSGVLAAPRTALSKYVPTILQTTINPDKIGLVIGPGGKTINGLIEKYALASIDIEEDGRVFVAAVDKAAAEQAMGEIKAMTREFTVGEIIEGRVIKNLEFGAIVDLGGGKDGMIHVSELRNGFVNKVDDVVKVGDFVKAKIISAEDDRIRLSVKQLTDEERKA
ncbi:MAG TPA: polyribonucleotide nucleotidyltransferase [Candidatus Paceibacterota bacterium]|nr:polyribonucleotide nucleotidyltransferase [Candidatus Paceibacterota bacterium]